MVKITEENDSPGSQQPGTSSMERYVVKSAPPRIRYIPDFISPEDEAFLLEQVIEAPKPKWQQLSNRRVQNWGGIIGRKGLIQHDDIPLWLQMCIDKVATVPHAFPLENRPNHVLINEYLPGQGIMPHTDGPAFYPLISTINLGGHTLLDFYEPINAEQIRLESERFVGSMLLEQRSLILIEDGAYQLMHGIAERTSDQFHERVFNWNPEIHGGPDTVMPRETRISLTIRNVPKVSALNVMEMLKKK